MRTCTRKIDRGDALPNNMVRITKIVIENPNYKDFSVRKVAKEYNCHYSTSSRYTAIFRKYNKETEDRLAPANCGYEASRLVFFS